MALIHEAIVQCAVPQRQGIGWAVTALSCKVFPEVTAVCVPPTNTATRRGFLAHRERERERERERTERATVETTVQVSTLENTNIAFTPMDRDKGGRGAGRQSSTSSSRDDPGGKKKSSGPAPTFVKNIPNFLQQYSHLLGTNKKNYMGEEMGHDDGADTAEDVVSGGGVVVEPPVDASEGEDEQPVVVGEEPNVHNVFREKAPGIIGIAAPVVGGETMVEAKVNDIKKVAFNKPSKKRKQDADQDDDNAESSGPKRTYKTAKKASLLSFDMED